MHCQVISGVSQTLLVVQLLLQIIEEVHIPADLDSLMKQSCSEQDHNTKKLVSSLVPAEMTDNDACAVHVYGSGKNRKLLAHTETCLLRVVDMDTLETGDKGGNTLFYVPLSLPRKLIRERG